MKDIETIVNQVTVYVDRVRISRSGSVSLETGEQQVAVINLPLNLDPDSVRAKAAGTARAKIMGVDVQKTFFKDVPPGKVRELSDQVQQLEDEDRALADNVESLTAQVKHIDGLSDATKTYAVSLAKGNSTPESHAAVIDFMVEKRLAAQEKLRRIAVERRELGRKLQKLRNELKQVENMRPRQRYAAVIELDVVKEGDLEVELTYTLPGVNWKPLYDIRLSENEMEINYLGQVTQRSGEDWDEVKLVLSTVPPAAGTTIPELEPWYVFPFIPPPPPPPMHVDRKKRAAKPSTFAAGIGAGMVADAAMDDILEEAEPVVEEAFFAAAAVEQSGASVTYAIDGKVKIPGDGSPHKAMIYCLKLPSETDYVTAPKIESKAYRRVYADNKSDLMLLPGMGQVFEAEDFIGKASLKMVAPGERIKLYAGTDERIRVERKLVLRETDKKFLADKRRISYAYEIKLENHTGIEQTITVRDQVPVARHEDIKVKLDSADPKVKEQDGLNRLKWEVKVPDKGKKTIRYEFFIEYPRDMRIQGLP
ncbi:MAG: mucoidy inhibitor MuiA family protein [Candidatus Aminicenantes bacterium]|nr:mucoidy inhibitor MuiA family protein [Candidatus Aminicenantes bacterium]